MIDIDYYRLLSVIDQLRLVFETFRQKGKGDVSRNFVTESSNIDCSQSSIFRKIIEIESFALRAAILHECQNYLGGGAPPPPRAIIPDARPLGTFENQDSRDGKKRYI